MNNKRTAFINGRIYSMKAENETYDAFVIEDDKFLYCGDSEAAQKIAEPNEPVDLQGKTVLPGFIDTHQHVLAYARDLKKLNLKSVQSIEGLKNEIQKRVSESQKGEWIQGTAFDHEKFPSKILPTRQDLDEIAPDNPVIITRYCLHISVANSKALQIAGIGKGFEPDVEGTVEFDEDGYPTGRLIDQAATDVVKMIPNLFESIEQKKDALELACKELNKKGITSVHAIQGKHVDLFEFTNLYQDLEDEGRLNARIYLGFDEFPTCGIRHGLGNEKVKYGFFKIYADGNLGAHSAAFIEPYDDDPSNVGIMNYEQAELDELIKRAYDMDLQIGVHMIGDRAISMVLSSLESCCNANPKNDVRFRMIHMSLINEDIISRMKNLPVIVDIQPMFVSTNVRWSESRVGSERAKYNYAWKRLLDEGFIISAGSDSPIESFDPLLGTYAITTRQGLDGFPEEGWYPEQRVTTFEALSMYTRNAAYASYEEHLKGTIESGKLADFVLLDKDPFQMNPAELKNVHVEKTYLGGNLVYSV